MGGKIVMSILAEHPELTSLIKGALVCDVGCYDYWNNRNIRQIMQMKQSNYYVGMAAGFALPYGGYYVVDKYFNVSSSL